MLAVTFDQFNVSLRNKYIYLLKKETLVTSNFWTVVYLLQLKDINGQHNFIYICNCFPLHEFPI